MSTTGHETEVVQVQGLKASLKKGGNKGLFNECICSTAGGTAAKVANTVPPSFSLVSEATIIVKFTYAISVANATFKVGDNDAKPIYYRGAALGANMIKAGDKVMLRYDGTSFNIIGSLGETYESKQAASGGTDLSLVTTGEKYTWNDKISSSAKGAANGVASLDANGKVPSSQLQSYVDDVIEGYYKKADGKFYEESTYTTEITGESGKIYTDLSTDTTYRWSGTQFTQIKGDLAIGTTTGTAADGGLVNTHVNDNDIHVTIQDKSNWSGKQDALEFNTPYNASTNKAATMADVPTAMSASGTNHKGGLVPDPGATQGTTKFLREDGSWQVPAYPTIEDFHEAVATLSATPTSSTLTYTRDGVTYEYKIGDQVRVHDTEKGTAEGNYFVFYTLKDKSNNTAYWEESGSGGESSGTGFYTPTLSAAPTSSTTTYTKDGVTVNFVIGQFARVADATMDTGYKFYQLADLNNGVAAWQEMGTPLERVTINLSANANLAALRSAAPTVTVTSTKSAGTIFSQAWTGDALKLKVEPGDTYTVSVEEVEGFATPASQTYDAELEGVNSITFNYATVEWSVAITSNQSSDATIEALTGTAEWIYNGNSYSESGLADGDVVYIPTGVTPTFTIADATGYKKTVTVVSPSITAVYETEVVTVTVGTDQSGVTAEGQNITINGTVFAVDSTGVITTKVPFDTQYSISADAKSGYTSPSAVSVTASQVSRDVTMTYTKVVFGVFAYYSDGSLKSESEADSNAIGVAVITSNARFVIDKTDALSSTTRYGGYNKDLSATAVTTSTQATAQADYRGEQNTTNIINALAGISDGYVTGAPAAEACRAKFGGLGYMGALGEWQEAYNNKSAVDSMMTKISGTAITNSYYWTSTHYNASSGSWRLRWSDGYVYSYTRSTYTSVRAFLAL